MERYFRSSSRGASVLGALVIALMLGTGAVATYELVNPSVASIRPESQVAQASGCVCFSEPCTCDKASTGELVENIPPKTLKHAGKEYSVNYACEQVADLKDIGKLEQNCQQGFLYNIVEEKGKVLVRPTVQSQCPTTSAPKPDKTCTKGPTRAACAEKGTSAAGTVMYCAGAATGKQKCYRAGDCNTDGKLGLEDKRKEGLVKAFKDAATTDKQQELANQLGLKQNDLEYLKGALSGEQKSVEDQIKEQQKRVDDAQSKLDALTAGCNTAVEYCPPEDIEAAKNKAEEEKKRLQQLQERLDQLKKDQVKLAAVKPGSTDDPNKTKDDPNKTKDDPNKQPSIPPSGPPASTFPPSQSQQQPKGGGQPGGQPQQQQQPQAQCNSQYICQNNAIYITQPPQCQPQLVQQCQFGCTYGQSTCNQTQQCLQPPPQPEPSLCKDGTWKPKYGGQNNGCVIGWDCTPGSPTPPGPTPPPPPPGTPKAEISCQPKIADVGMTLSITYSCSEGTSTGSGFETDGARSGATTTIIKAPPGGANTATYALTCTNEGKNATASCSVQVAKPAIVLVANPKTLESGKTSALGWVTSGMNSCVISSVAKEDAARYGFKDSIEHLPAFTSDNAGKTSPNGTAVTPALVAKDDATTVYGFLLNCATVGGGTKVATSTISATPQ